MLPALGHGHLVSQEAGFRETQFEQGPPNLASPFGVALTQFVEHGRPLLRLDELLAAGFEFGLRLPSTVAVLFERGGHAPGGPGFVVQRHLQGLDLGADGSELPIDRPERVPAAKEDLVRAFAAIDRLLAADAFGDQTAAQFALVRSACSEFVQEQALPLAGFRDRGVGLADPPPILLDGGKGLLAFRLELPPPSEQSGQAFFGRRAVASPPLGTLGAGLESFGDFSESAAGAVDLCLTSLDHREQLRLALVRAHGVLGAGFDHLLAGGELRVSPCEFSQQVGLAVRFLLQGRGQIVQVGPKENPALPEHLVEQVAVGLPALSEATGRVCLPFQGAQSTLHLGDDVVETEQGGGRVLELERRQALAVLVAGDAGRFLEELAPVLGFARQDHSDPPLLDHGVGADAQTRVHQDVADVLESDDAIVQPVLGVAAAVDAATDRDPAILRLRRRAVGEEGETDLRHPQGLALVAAAKYDFLHGGSTEGLGALLAQHPGDRLGQVALAAAVRPDDRGDARREAAGDRLDEGLEAVDLETFQFEHGCFGQRSGRLPCGNLAAFMHMSQLVVSRP